MANVNIEDLPSNSMTSKREEERKNLSTRKHEIAPVVKGKVRTKKVKMSQRFVDAFFGEDVGDVKSYLLMDILIPKTKDLISDIVSNGIDMVLGLEPRRGSGNRNRNGSTYVSYNKYSTPSYKQEESRGRSTRQNGSYYFDVPIFESRGEAEEVLSNLVDLIEDFGQARISELYDMCGITGQFTDEYWGWLNLSQASVKRVRDGYMLELPRPVSLK